MRTRLQFGSRPDLLYVIGDVHGQISLLRSLEVDIAKDAAGIPGSKCILLLGDFIDRGQRSAHVLDYLCRRPPDGFTRICLAGNHEIMMLDALEGRRSLSQWLEWGGLETLLSYGISPEVLRSIDASPRRFKHIIDAHIPDEHLEFLRGLPVAAEFPDLLAVHAGARSDLPLSEQSDEQLTLNGTCTDKPGIRAVIHGHTIVEKPLVSATEINVDTGAYLTGKLTAARIVDGLEITFLQALS
jgi:serine/threonine protein phosphatase 1